MFFWLFQISFLNNCVLYSCGHICYSWNLIKDHLFHYAAMPWPQIRQLGLLCIIFTHHANQTYYRKFQSDSRERARRLAVSVLVILSHCSTWVCDRWNLQICFHWNRENSRLLSMYKRHYLVWSWILNPWEFLNAEESWAIYKTKPNFIMIITMRQTRSCAIFGWVN